MRQGIVHKLFLFWVLLLAIIFRTGCAGKKSLIRDKSVKVESPDGAVAAKTVEKPEEKVFVDDKGEFEFISTPFGYIKHRIKRPEREPETPIRAREPAAPSTEKFTAPVTPPQISMGKLAKPAPVIAEKPEEKEASQDVGQIVFNFDDADLYEVIRTIAELLNINYIVDPNVRGKVMIHTAGGLRREDLFPVFFQILEANNLADLLNSVFAWEPSAKEKTTKDKPEKKAETAPFGNPLSRKTKEAKAEEAPEARKESKETMASGKMQTTGSGTLKGEINITADKIRNALIIKAVPADYRVIEEILRQIDVLPRQVLIEVTIAEISLDESTELGIEWTYLKGPGSLGTSLLDASLGTSGFRYTIGMTDRWTSALAFLASQDKVNILSSPSVLASDNKEAKIDISTEIPVASAEYRYASDKEPVLETTIEYRDTGVLLSVTPHINERGLVTMDINQEVSEQSHYVGVGDKKYPSFYKRSVNTTLTVKHAQTIVIGGLIKETKSEGSAGAPWLSKIPIIRYLFGQEKKKVSKTELIILTTWIMPLFAIEKANSY